MAKTSAIIEMLGGATKVAQAIGVPMTTVHGWKRSEHVPAWRIPALVGLAKRQKKALKAEDFPVKPRTRKPADATSDRVAA